MRNAGCWGIVCVLALGSMVQAQDDAAIRRSVVKVFCTSNQVDLSNPWKRGGSKQATGSGIWLGEKRILTNDHVVNYATQISVQPYESADRIPAEVVMSSPEMDLAIIEVESDAPFEGLEPPTFAKELPKLRETVRVYGYPEGGSSMSVTEGIVSRIEYRGYAHGSMGLMVQVDAAINPGNSGGPAYVGDQVIGLAFQKRASSDNIGYLIPSEEVLEFMEDIKDGQYDGKPVVPVLYQHLLNQALRSNLGLESSSTGVWIRDVDPSYDEYPLKKDDVITHIGELNIDNSGQTQLRENLRVSFEYFVPVKAKDGKVELKIIRDGQEMTVNASVNLRRDGVLKSLKGTYPTYFVYGPLVLAVATSEYISGIENLLGSSDARRRMSGVATLALMMRRQSPLMMRRFDFPKFEGEQLVVVANWLPHRITLGYSPPVTQVVKEVNGTEIKNLKHLVETLRDCEDEYVKFTLADHRVETLVFQREKVEEATEDILINNGIPRQASGELLKVWNEE
jgi:S1-C subfamily serine protease